MTEQRFKLLTRIQRDLKYLRKLMLNTENGLSVREAEGTQVPPGRRGEARGPWESCLTQQQTLPHHPWNPAASASLERWDVQAKAANPQNSLIPHSFGLVCLPGDTRRCQPRAASRSSTAHCTETRRDALRKSSSHPASEKTHTPNTRRCTFVIMSISIRFCIFSTKHQQCQKASLLHSGPQVVTA